MSRRVLIVETPEKAKTLEVQLGEGAETVLVSAMPIRASMRQPKERLRRGGAVFDFAPLPEGEDFLDRLRTCQGREIYLAFDGDWRGEYWAWLISGYWDTLTQGGEQLRRLGLLGLAGDVLQESFRLVAPVQAERAQAIHVKIAFESALARHLVRLLGTRSGPNGLPLTALGLSILFLLAERESEIRMYSPIPCWRLQAKVMTEGSGEALLTLEEAYGITDDALLRNDREVHGAIALFNNENFVVAAVESTQFSVPPPAPYALAELLHDAVVLGGLTPSAAFGALRSLYHGVELDGQPRGLVTAYSSIDGQGLGAVLARIRRQASTIVGAGGVGAVEQVEIPPGVIVPILPEITPEALQGKLDPAEAVVYRLIWSRALANQLGEAIGEALRVTVEAGSKCRFVGTARKVTSPGFLSLYQGCMEKELLAASPLAEVREGEVLRCAQIFPEKHAGHPPEYHALVSLGMDLGELGMELDGSTISMIQQMLDKGYLKLMPDGSFRCAENAAKLVAVMNRAFPSMKGINFSAYLAQVIEEVVSSRKSFAVAMQQFEQTLMMRGEVLVKVAVPVSVRKRGISSRSIIRASTQDIAQPVGDEQRPPPPPPVGDAAHEEESALPASTEPAADSCRDREGMGPETLAVAEPESLAVGTVVGPGGRAVTEQSGEDSAGPEEAEVVDVEALDETPELHEEEALAPELHAAVARMFAEATESIVPEQTSKAASSPVEASAEEEARVIDGPARECPECGRPLLLKEDRFGRFWYCSGHPACRHSESYEKESTHDMECPLCRVGSVVSKHTPTGKLFYVCPEVECEFMSWSKPHALPCRVCGSPFLVERRTMAGAIMLSCPKAGCNYTQPLTGVGGEATVQPRKKVVVRRVVRSGGASPVGGTTRKVRVVRKKQ